MLRIFKNIGAGADFNDFPQIHHGNAMADAFDHGHIVGDKQVRQTQLLLEIEHQIDDLRFHRHIQRRHRFVGNNKLGFQRQRASDADPLTLPAGKLMRKTRCHIALQPDLFEQLRHTNFCAGGIMQPEAYHRFSNCLPDAHARIQALKRILKNHLCLRADLCKMRPVGAAYILPGNQHVAGGGFGQP